MAVKGKFDQLKIHFDQVIPKFTEYDIMFQTNNEWKGKAESMLSENEVWKTKAEETLRTQQKTRERNIENQQDLDNKCMFGKAPHGHPITANRMVWKLLDFALQLVCHGFELV